MDRSTRSALRLFCLSLLCLLALAPASPAQDFDPAAWQRQIEASQVEPARAVTLKGIRLNAGLATLSLEDGVLFPAGAVAGRTVEMVFLGKGRIVLEPPDEIEEGQLDLFTGSNRLDETFTEMVLVLGLDPAVDALLGKPKASPEPALAQRATELYANWKRRPERKILNVEGAILADAAGDRSAQGYVSAWLRGGELGDFLYVVDPAAAEQVTLGHFVPLEATEKEKRKLLRQIDKQKRQGRLIGVELEDLGQWDTWLSASLRSKDGKPMVGAAAFEPSKYTLEVNLANDLRMIGKARIDLTPVLQAARAVSLSLSSDLQVQRVTDAAGASLFFQRAGSDLLVLLPQPASDDKPVTLVVEYEGAVIDKDGNTYALSDTWGWYPHAGTVDRATYDVTFRWPKKVDLLACGKRVDGGEAAGRLWERRVFETPAAWFTFEVGRYKVETVQAGHIRVNLAFDPDAKNLLEKKDREEIQKTIVDSLAYFEELFGPYPMDEITVVNVPRDFSQSSPGFVTLSTVMMFDLDVWNLFVGMEDRRTVIAHEISHQWWGHAVGWSSYRDQWISEAMANYSALLYGRNRLEWKDRYGLGPTAGWQEALTGTTADGRPIESLGPIVLGTRLFSSRSSSDAYEAIVYRKGAVVLDMLAQALGQSNFPKVLRQIVKAAANRPVSTSQLLDLMERITGAELDPFAKQFIYGTGLPEVYYTYRISSKGPGKWAVEGEARQQAPYRFRYKVVQAGQGYDVAREKLDQIQVEGSTLVVPFQVDIYNPDRDDRKDRKKGGNKSNALLRGTLVLQGEATPFSLETEYEPSGFSLDRDEAVFGRFFNESRQPKRMLFYRGLDAAAANNLAEAEDLYKRALGAEVEVAATEGTSLEKESRKKEGKGLDAQIELSLARLYLDQGKDALAQESLDKAQRVLGSYEGWVEAELKVLQARLEMRRGEYEKAFKRLRKGILGRGDLESTEGYILLAIAAKATNHQQELEQAVKTAEENGADLSALTGS